MIKNLLPTEEILKLKNSIDIQEFYSKYLELKKSGNNYWACCPFHNEKTPSFCINSDTGVFKCFGGCSDVYGDIIDFYQKINEVDFQDALFQLSQEYGIELNFNEEYIAELNKIKSLQETNKKVSSHYRKILKSDKEGLQYLQDREINIDSINKFKLGSCNSYELLWDKFGSDVDNLKELSLIKESDANDNLNNYFYGKRIMFPCIDEHNKIIGYNSRIIEGNFKPKYFKSKLSILDNPSFLYGIHLAKPYIKQYKNVFIVEGNVDCIMAHQNGINNCVALSSLNLLPEQVKYLYKLTKNFTLCLDTDSSALKRIEAIYKTIVDNCKFPNIRIISLIDVENNKDNVKIDLDLFLRKYGKSEFFNKIKSSKIYNEYMINIKLNNQKPKNIEEQTACVYMLKEHLNSIKNYNVRSGYVKLVADKLNMSEAIIYNIIKKFDKPQKQELNVRSSDSSLNIAYKYLISVLFLDIDTKSKNFLLDICDIKNNIFDKNYLNLFNYIHDMVLQNLNNNDILDIVNNKYRNNSVSKITTDIFFKANELNTFQFEELKIFLLDQVNVTKEEKNV
jgi:DNA primase